jgi:two-component system, NarL family, sensor histidine kinase FusK
MFENPSGPVSNPGIPAAWRTASGWPAVTPALRWPYSATVSLVAGAYLLAAWIGLLLAIPPGYASPVWPPAGIALAALLALGSAALPGIFIGAAAANIGVMGTAPVVALAIGAGNAAEALVAGLLIHRFIGSRDWFETSGSVARFVAIAFTASMVAASNGVLTLALAGQVPWAEFGTHWTTWWLGDATGIVIVAPLLLCWRQPARERARHKAEYALFAALLLLCAAMIRLDNRAVQDAVQTLAYLMIPLVTWAATRLDRRAVTVASFAISAIAVVDVLDGRAAPFVSLALNESLLLMQLFVSMVATTGLTLSAFSGEIARANRRAAAGEQGACAARLTALARRMVQVRDDERRHLAAELHDGLAQHLTGLNVSLDVVRVRVADSHDSWLLERIDEAASLTKGASQCIRDVMVGLRPPDANSAPLSSTLRRHAAAFETRTGILVSVNAPLAPLRVESEVKDSLGRICLEALNNVSKHADADSVRVTLQTTAGCVELNIEDDGVGFDAARPVPDEDRSRLGLRIMEERALSIGGSFRVVSTPGAGTSIEVVVPRSRG